MASPPFIATALTVIALTTISCKDTPSPPSDAGATASDMSDFAFSDLRLAGDGCGENIPRRDGQASDGPGLDRAILQDQQEDAPRPPDSRHAAEGGTDLPSHDALGDVAPSLPWSQVPHNTSAYAFTDMWGSSANDVWAVGLGGAIARWDGLAWFAMNSPTSKDLEAIWGAGLDDIWIAGDKGALFHWDGAAWVDHSGGSLLRFSDLWGSASDDVWAISSTTLGRWDGTTWTYEQFPSALSIYTIWGFSGQVVWAAGVNGQIFRWSVGSGWSAVASPTTDDLNDIWGSAPDDIWAVGYAGRIVHWDGSSWQTTSRPQSSYGLSHLWGSGADNVYAVGNGGTIQRWDGASWAIIPSGTNTAVWGIWGSGPLDIWAAGGMSFMLHYP